LIRDRFGLFLQFRGLIHLATFAVLKRWSLLHLSEAILSNLNVLEPWDLELAFIFSSGVIVLLGLLSLALAKIELKADLVFLCLVTV